jgi:broad specificity phosphatase PhoE
VTKPTIVLWRHGRTSWNAELRWQGQSDIPLDDVGRQQAQAAAEKLAALQPTAIYASDLMRAHDTALQLGSVTGLDVVTDARLRETHGGNWEGLTQSEIREQYPDHLHAWLRDMHLPAGVTGENRFDVASRLHTAIEDFTTRHPTGTIVVATHGGSARAAMMSLLDLPMEHLTAFKVLTNCAWAVLNHDDVRNTWQISDYNVTALPPLEESHL